MSLSTPDVLEAYRADLSNAGKIQFSDDDATWLAFGTLLQRAVKVPAADRRDFLSTGARAVVGELPNNPMTQARRAVGARRWMGTRR